MFSFDVLGQLREIDEPVHKSRVSLLQRFLDEGRNEYIAAYVDVFAQPKPLFRNVQAKLHGFAGLGLSKCPLVPDVEAQGRVYMSLEAVRQVVEAGMV